jgi:hypothetical protein
VLSPRALVRCLCEKRSGAEPAAGGPARWPGRRALGGGGLAGCDFECEEGCDGVARRRWQRREDRRFRRCEAAPTRSLCVHGGHRQTETLQRNEGHGAAVRRGASPVARCARAAARNRPATRRAPSSAPRRSSPDAGARCASDRRPDLLVTIASGVAMRLVDGGEYPTIGLGMWWAAQTVTTVGYGDVAPHETAGRIVALVVMFDAVGLMAVVTGAVTATLIEGAGPARPRLIDSSTRATRGDQWSPEATRGGTTRQAPDGLNESRLTSSDRQPAGGSLASRHSRMLVTLVRRGAHEGDRSDHPRSQGLVGGAWPRIRSWRHDGGARTRTPSDR